ncbi:MAG: ArnT family glycosyltransferase [Cyanobium sp.]
MDRPAARGAETSWLALLPYALGAILRLIRIQGPVVGVHSWRQADTAAIARHFAEGGMRWWLPQIDWGGASAGTVEAEFPLYPYLVAGLYRLLGVHEWLARGLTITASLLSLWLVIRLGRRLLGEGAGWWGGMAWAVLPLSVYYGRTVQAESLLLLLAACSLDRFLAWQDHGRWRDLVLSWLAFSGCGLLKVLPLFWLGIPLAWLWLRAHGWRALSRSPIWLYPLGALLLTAAWYVHAHQLGQQSGLSFGFWMGDTNRYSWSTLLGPGYWLNLSLRTVVRGLAVLALPLLLVGLRDSLRPMATVHQDSLPVDPRRAPVLALGLLAVLMAGATAPESSSVHEYYQLPLLLFACPLIGLGVVQLGQGHRRWIRPAAGSILVIALLILSLDYWRVEARQEALLMPIAAAIQQQTTPAERIVSVSGPDPTLLNLARRQGWLTSPKKVDGEALNRWQAEGARAVAGSFEVIESYSPFPRGRTRLRLRTLICGSSASACHGPEGASFYVLHLEGSGPGSRPAA